MTTSWPAMARGQRLEVLDVAVDDLEARVAVVMREVPVATRGEVVVDGDPLGLGSASRRSTKWLPMKPAPPTMKYRPPSLSGSRLPLASRGASSAGWLTSRCQTTAHSPSVCGVIRSATSGGMTTHASATRGGEAAVAADDAEDLRPRPPARARARGRCSPRRSARRHRRRRRRRAQRPSARSREPRSQAAKTRLPALVVDRVPSARRRCPSARTPRTRRACGSR